MIRPRQFLGDTPTPSLPETKPCSRRNHIKPLADFIDRDTGEVLNDCEACRVERANERRREQELAKALENIQHRQEELERVMGIHGMFKCHRAILIIASQPVQDCFDQPAISENDRELLRNFHNELAAVTMDECVICCEKWFDMDVDAGGICG